MKPITEALIAMQLAIVRAQRAGLNDVVMDALLRAKQEALREFHKPPITVPTPESEQLFCGSAR